MGNTCCGHQVNDKGIKSKDRRLTDIQMRANGRYRNYITAVVAKVNEGWSRDIRCP